MNSLKRKTKVGNTIHYYKTSRKPAEKVIRNISISQSERRSKQEDGKQPKKDLIRVANSLKQRKTVETQFTIINQSKNQPKK